MLLREWDSIKTWLQLPLTQCVDGSLTQKATEMNGRDPPYPICRQPHPLESAPFRLLQQGTNYRFCMRKQPRRLRQFTLGMVLHTAYLQGPLHHTTAAYPRTLTPTITVVDPPHSICRLIATLIYLVDTVLRITLEVLQKIETNFERKNKIHNAKCTTKFCVVGVKRRTKQNIIIEEPGPS